MNHSLQVYEHQPIQLGKTPGFKTHHLNALVRFNERKENYNKYFTLSYKGVKFKEYVGVIQADDLTIEVLPKADRGANEDQKSLWRNVLLEMLKSCSLLEVQHLENANLLLKQNSLLEIYCQLFLNECSQLLHEGLVKKYRQNNSNKLSLKGRLLFSEHIKSNLVHAERFYTRSQSYDCDNVFNQILYTTLKLIPLISTVSSTHSSAYNLLCAFPELPDINATGKLFSSLKFDRKTDRYREAIFISQLLLLNYRPDIKGGNENVLAIMFDMNELWEEYIFRKLKKVEGDFQVQVSRQERTNFWWNSDIHSNKVVRPDIVLRFPSSDRKPIVIDTKWKVPFDLKPADADLKQMFLYNLYWGANISILLYPSQDGELITHKGYYYNFDKLDNFHSACYVQTITVLNDQQFLDKMIGVKLFEQILELTDHIEVTKS